MLVEITALPQITPKHFGACHLELGPDQCSMVNLPVSAIYPAICQKLIINVAIAIIGRNDVGLRSPCPSTCNWQLGLYGLPTNVAG